MHFLNFLLSWLLPHALASEKEECSLLSSALAGFCPVRDAHLWNSHSWDGGDPCHWSCAGYGTGKTLKYRCVSLPVCTGIWTVFCVFSAICYEAEDLSMGNDHGNTLLSDSVITQKEASHSPNRQHRFLYWCCFPWSPCPNRFSLAQVLRSEGNQLPMALLPAEEQRGEAEVWTGPSQSKRKCWDFSRPQGPMYFPFRQLSLIFYLQFEAQKLRKKVPFAPESFSAAA